jgi:N-carbamoylputrescine amidase
MRTLKIALLQMASQGLDQEANLAHGDVYCRKAKELDSDIALFPEMWNIGYTFFDPSSPEAHIEWASHAIDENDEFFKHYVDLSQELDMAIGLTYLEKHPMRPRNSFSLINRHGKVVFSYAKVHTCAFDEEAALSPGDRFSVGLLDTRVGDVKIGAMICFDREFPESARILMLAGAEIILTPNACELEANRLTQFRSRAFENMVGVAMTNYAPPKANGRSVAYDGIAFDEEEQSLDTLIVEALDEEEVFIAEFDLDRLRRYRKHEVWGNAFRRPECYSLLTSTKVSEPFRRL